MTLQIVVNALMSLLGFVSFAVGSISLFVLMTAITTRQRRWAVGIVSDWRGWREMICVIMLVVLTVHLVANSRDWFLSFGSISFFLTTYVVVPLVGRNQRY